MNRNDVLVFYVVRQKLVSMKAILSSGT